MLVLHKPHYTVRQADRFNLECFCDLKIYGHNDRLTVIITEPISEDGAFICLNPVNERLAPIAIALWLEGFRFTNFVYYVPSYGVTNTANLATIAHRNEKAFFTHSETLFYFDFPIIGNELVAKCTGEAILEHVEVLIGERWQNWHGANNHSKFEAWSY